MKLTFPFTFLIFLAIGCSQRTSETSGASADSTALITDTTQVKQDEPTPVEVKEDRKSPELNDANLIRFSFATASINEYDFNENGILVRSAPVNGQQTEGRWSLSGSTIKISFDSDTASFEVRSFTEGELNLVTTDEFGGKLFGEVDREGYYYIKLHRLIFSSPFPASQIAGGWQESNGGCSFGEDGNYSFGAPDCVVTGRWQLSEGYIYVEIINSDCGSNVPSTMNLEVLRLAPGLMIVLDDQDAFDVYTREPEK